MSDRPNLPNTVLDSERTILVGDMLSLFTYGISFVIFIQAISRLYLSPRRFSGEKRNWILIAYASFIFGLGTIFIATDLRAVQLMFIDHRAYPGGPVAYDAAQYDTAAAIVPNVAGIMAGWLADAFLLYRCLVVFHFKFYVIMLPVLMYISTIPMGIMLLFESSRPDATLFTGVSIKFGIAYYSLSVSLNIIITLAITFRLLLFRYEIKRSIGSPSSLPYVSISAMLLESSSLYAAISLLFIISYAVNSPASHIFLPNLAQIQILAPMLIVWRVADRRAWTSHTASAVLSTMHFNQEGPSHVHSTLSTFGQSEAEQGGITVELERVREEKETDHSV